MTLNLHKAALIVYKFLFYQVFYTLANKQLFVTPKFFELIDQEHLLPFFYTPLLVFSCRVRSSGLVSMLEDWFLSKILPLLVKALWTEEVFGPRGFCQVWVDLPAGFEGKQALGICCLPHYLNCCILGNFLTLHCPFVCALPKDYQCHIMKVQWGKLCCLIRITLCDVAVISLVDEGWPTHQN